MLQYTHMPQVWSSSRKKKRPYERVYAVIQTRMYTHLQLVRPRSSLAPIVRSTSMSESLVRLSMHVLMSLLAANAWKSRENVILARVGVEIRGNAWFGVRVYIHGRAMRVFFAAKFCATCFSWASMLVSVYTFFSLSFTIHKWQTRSDYSCLYTHSFLWVS